MRNKQLQFYGQNIWEKRQFLECKCAENQDSFSRILWFSRAHFWNGRHKHTIQILIFKLFHFYKEFPNLDVFAFYVSMSRSQLCQRRGNLISLNAENPHKKSSKCIKKCQKKFTFILWLIEWLCCCLWQVEKYVGKSLRSIVYFFG